MDEDAALFGLVLPEIEEQEDIDFEGFKSNWPVL